MSTSAVTIARAYIAALKAAEHHLPDLREVLEDPPSDLEVVEALSELSTVAGVAAAGSVALLALAGGQAQRVHGRRRMLAAVELGAGAAAASCTCSACVEKRHHAVITAGHMVASAGRAVSATRCNVAGRCAHHAAGAPAADDCGGS